MSHLEEIIGLGFLVEEQSKESIEKINDKKFEEFKKYLKEEKPFMVTKDVIVKFLARDIEIVKHFKPVDSFTVNDFVQSLNKRYSFLQDVLLSKVKLKNIDTSNEMTDAPSLKEHAHAMSYGIMLTT